MDEFSSRLRREARGLIESDIVIHKNYSRSYLVEGTDICEPGTRIEAGWQLIEVK